jgi:hypothetical protein
MITFTFMVRMPLNTKFVRGKFEKKYGAYFWCFLDIVDLDDDLYCFFRGNLCSGGVYFIMVGMIALYFETDIMRAAFIFEY